MSSLQQSINTDHACHYRVWLGSNWVTNLESPFLESMCSWVSVWRACTGPLPSSSLHSQNWLFTSTSKSAYHTHTDKFPLQIYFILFFSETNVSLNNITTSGNMHGFKAFPKFYNNQIKVNLLKHLKALLQLIIQLCLDPLVFQIL